MSQRNFTNTLVQHREADMQNNTVYEWIFQTAFTASARLHSLKKIEPYLSVLARTGDEVLDICCGSGFVSLWFAAQGCQVIGMDFAPYMISAARDEAKRRNLPVEFVEADIFKQDFGCNRYDIISCVDSLTDFPITEFAGLGKKIANALKPGGRFIVKYGDGSSKYINGCAQREGVYQEVPERITFRFKEYLPELGAKVNIIRNETRGVEYERKGYIYTAPIVRLAMCDTLDLEQHVALDKDEFRDVFIKRSQ